MYLLDTTHCLKLFKGVIEEKLSSLEESVIAISVITRGELIFGVYKSERVNENMAEVKNFLRLLDIYMVDETTAEIYGEIKNTLLDRFGPKDRSKRRNVKIQSLGFQDNDLWIAATAIQHRLVLVSADKHIQRLQGIHALKVESW
jgi:tRNA(fMet)-specific endonuclease VapC